MDTGAIRGEEAHAVRIDPLRLGGLTPARKVTLSAELRHVAVYPVRLPEVGAHLAAGVVYGFITYTLVRGGETARRAALVCCAAELVGVLTVGTWTLVEPSAFPDATVWSDYGMGYLFIPVLLPLTAVYWLRRARPGQRPAS